MGRPVGDVGSSWRGVWAGPEMARPAKRPGAKGEFIVIDPAATRSSSPGPSGKKRKPRGGDVNALTTKDRSLTKMLMESAFSEILEEERVYRCGCDHGGRSLVVATGQRPTANGCMG